MDGHVIVVVGGGVIGLTTAIPLIQQFGSEYKILIYSKELSPNTTSDLSGGIIWLPAFTTQDRIVRLDTRNI
jgi:glycine/D-amino acid oxidase-like deaminating enzyme